MISLGTSPVDVFTALLMDVWKKGNAFKKSTPELFVKNTVARSQRSD